MSNNFHEKVYVPQCGKWMLSHRGCKYLIFLHIYTVIAQKYDPFQEYSVKKGQCAYPF